MLSQDEPAYTLENFEEAVRQAVGLDRISTSVADLINDGRLEEAEAACQALRDQYPDVIDGLMCKAMLHEARGETQLAIKDYERMLDYMDDNPDDFEPASRDPVRDAIDRLRR